MTTDLTPEDILPDDMAPDIKADLEIVKAVDAYLFAASQPLERGNAVQKTLRQWLTGYMETPADPSEQQALWHMAADLELFTPSASGSTLIDRYLKAHPPQGPVEQQAQAALKAAHLHLLGIDGRSGPDEVQATDLASGDRIVLLDDVTSPAATGLQTLMRLCPLPSGRYVCVSPLFVIEDETMDQAMTFVRPGRPLSLRCAAAVYRDVARKGVTFLPAWEEDDEENALLDELSDLMDQLSPVAGLAVNWIGVDSKEDEAALEEAAREMASGANLLEACSGAGYEEPDAEVSEALATAYQRIAELQIEVLSQRPGYGEILETVASTLNGLIEAGTTTVEARELFDRLKARFPASAQAGPAG